MQSFIEFLSQRQTNSWRQARYSQKHWPMPSKHGLGNQSPTCALGEYGTASDLVHPQPKPAPSLYCLAQAWGGCRGEICPLAVYRWQDLTCELKIHSCQELRILGHIATTHTYTHSRKTPTPHGRDLRVQGFTQPLFSLKFFILSHQIYAPATEDATSIRHIISLSLSDHFTKRLLQEQPCKPAMIHFINNSHQKESSHDTNAR